jgi:DNA repair photolyase
VEPVTEQATPSSPRARRGRGAASQPDPRFVSTTRESFDDGWTDTDPALETLPTEVRIEQPRSIIARNDSPDIPFEQSINPYRGCEHGCAYCYARPSHAYLDLSPGLDFESKLFAKPDAAAVLRRELAAPGYRCRTIAFGTNTDPYQPIERNWRITRALLELLYQCRHPFSIVTKSALIERDLDVIGAAAALGLAQVHVSVTTLDRDLARRLEPRAAAPHRRLQAIAALARARVPTGVMFAPVIPALNDHELEAVLEAGASAGARHAGYILLRLPREVNAIFKTWLAHHAPLRAEHVLNRIRDMRGGAESDSQFGSRMRGTGVFAQLLRQRFDAACRRHGLVRSERELDVAQFRPPRPGGQLDLF